MKNKQLYEYAQKLSIFNEFDKKLPVKISFYLHKNIKAIQEAVEEIEMARMNIGQKFGKLNETQNGYNILPENMQQANQELMDLFELEQDIKIHYFKIEDFDNIELSYQELSAIMFMIEE